MKNYFIANGEMLNTDMSIEEIESRVQESLDEYTSGQSLYLGLGWLAREGKLESDGKEFKLA
jgi:hypothetical protein